MKSPIQLTFHHVQPSPAISARIRTATQHLERFYGRITSCHVVITAIQRHRRHANPYRVCIELIVPGTRLVIGRRPAHRVAAAPNASSPKAEASTTDARHQDLYVAIHDAFDAARRRLEHYARKQRARQKQAA
jgi:ribosome-associated translation inhibitor RaiA